MYFYVNREMCSKLVPNFKYPLSNKNNNVPSIILFRCKIVNKSKTAIAGSKTKISAKKIERQDSHKLYVSRKLYWRKANFLRGFINEDFVEKVSFDLILCKD